MSRVPSEGFTPQSIANTILLLSYRDKTPVTCLKLVKLVYFVYAWYLAATAKRIFNDPIEAWDYGPVVPAIYHEFKEFGRQPITYGFYSANVDIDDSDEHENSSSKNYPPHHSFELDDECFPKNYRDRQKIDFIGENEGIITTVIDTVWEAYGLKDGTDLIEITHSSQSPWRKVWQKGKNNVLKDSDIQKTAKAAIEKYFVEKDGK